MFIFKVSDLIERLREINEAGLEYVELGLYEADDEFPSHIHFEAVTSYNSGIDYEEIETVKLPPDYDSGIF